MRFGVAIVRKSCLHESQLKDRQKLFHISCPLLDLLDR
jgi:hypothetical protein